MLSVKNQLGFWQTLTRLSALLCEELAASQRPRPRLGAGRAASEQIRWGPPWLGAGTLLTARQDKSSPGWSHGGAGPYAIMPGSPCSSRRITSALPKTGWLTSKLQRPDVWCIAMSIVTSLFSSANPPVPQHGVWGGGNIEFKSEMSFLFFLVQSV